MLSIYIERYKSFRKKIVSEQIRESDIFSSYFGVIYNVNQIPSFPITSHVIFEVAMKRAEETLQSRLNLVTGTAIIRDLRSCAQNYSFNFPSITLEMGQGRVKLGQLAESFRISQCVE